MYVFIRYVIHLCIHMIVVDYIWIEIDWQMKSIELPDILEHI
jgi:hypothetical protein